MTMTSVPSRAFTLASSPETHNCKTHCTTPRKQGNNFALAHSRTRTHNTAYFMYMSMQKKQHLFTTG